MLKKISILFLLALLMLVGLFVYLLEPHIELNRERASAKPIEIDTIYVNVTGEPGCAKLYRLDTGSKQTQVVTKIPVFVYLPEGMPSPVEGNYAYADNKFTLNGYEYKWVKKNAITGEIVEYPAARFDIVNWRLHVPYKLWTSLAPSKQAPDVKTSIDPVEYTYESSKLDVEYFVGQNSIDCLKQKL